MRARRHGVAATLTMSAVFFVGAAMGARVQAADPAPDVSTLPDGARLIVLPEPGETRIVIDVFFRVGQSDEGRYPGINSLIARAWTGGSDNRSAALIEGDIARHGTGVGTSAQSDYTEIWGISAPDRESFSRSAQSLLTNFVGAPLFAREAVEAARADQLGAIQLRRDNLLEPILDGLSARAFGESPYGNPVMGTPETVATIPWQQVGNYYRKHFRPDRAVIVVAGPVTAEEARKRVIGSIGAGGWDDEQAKASRDVPAIATPIPAGMRVGIVPRRAPAIGVAAGYLAPGTGWAQGRTDYAALVVLDAVLGGGKASRLFGLRDRIPPDGKPIGYEIRSELFPRRTQSLWAVYVLGDRPPEEVRTNLQATFEALATGADPVRPDELVHAKTYLKARHAEGRQRIKERAAGAGWAEVMGLSADFDTAYDERIDAVTTADVNRMARTVLGGNPAVVHSLPPRP